MLIEEGYLPYLYLTSTSVTMDSQSYCGNLHQNVKAESVWVFKDNDTLLFKQ